MGIAALVLGIVAIIGAWIPVCNYFSLLPALVGVILGIVDLVKKKKEGGKKGMAIAGLILSGISLLIIIGWTILIAVGAMASY